MVHHVLLICLHSALRTPKPFSKPWLRVWIQLRLAWPRGFLTICVLCLYALIRVSDERTEPEAESKVNAVDSKRAPI